MINGIKNGRTSMSIKNLIKQYIKESLFNHDIVGKYVRVASIIFRGSQKLGYQDEFCDWDLEFLLSDDKFREFAEEHGSKYVLIDKKHQPEIFMRVKSYQWLREKFLDEPIICAWVYQESLIVQDPKGVCGEIINFGIERFKEQREQRAWEKYVEYRSHRHDLRSSLARNLEITVAFVRSAMVKSLLEFALLSQGNSYPYKKWLSLVVEREVSNSRTLVGLCRDFLVTDDKIKLLKLDMALLKIAIMLGKGCGFKEKNLEEWWLHLD